jgi:signal transduction histidine kinase
MTRRLYLRLYFSFLGVLLAVVAVTAVINVVTGRGFPLFRGGPRVANHLARMLDRPEPLERILGEMHDELGVDVAVFGPQGDLLASAGAPLPRIDSEVIEHAREGPGWMAHGLVASPVRRLPGAVLVARLPVPEGMARGIAIRRTLLLIGTLLVSLLLVYPLSRSITRPIEKLTAAVEAYGRGDLARRSGLGDLKDEVGQLARSFDEMADRIQTARRAEKELLANVSHELRTPLARMKVVLELIDSRDESIRRRLAALHEEVDELDWLIADMLTATRLDLASLPLHKVPLKVADVVEKARQRALALRPQPLVEVRVEQDLSLEVDEALLARAIDNLLDNARKYGNGTPVEVEARREGSQALIAVRDRGPGFAEAELEHLFDPFFRGESARGQAPGFGLGLALAKRVVEAHGGTATALNVEGGGARIELRLPAIPRPPSYS